MEKRVQDYLQERGEKVLNLAGDLKVQAEAFLLYNRELSIEVVGGEVETLKQAEEIGLGVRVIDKGRLGFAYTTDLSDAALKKTVERAVYIARYAETDEHNVLPAGEQVYINLPLYDENIEKESLENKIELAREIERGARHKDKRIKIVERAGYEDTSVVLVIMNTAGLKAAERANFCGGYIFLVAEEDGDAQHGFAAVSKRRFKDILPRDIGEEGAVRALRALKPGAIKTGNMPCVMEPYVVTRFLGIIAAAVSGDAVQKGKSMLKGRIGDKVAFAKLTLVDDGLYVEGMGAFPFDGEGVAARKNTIIANGVLRSFLYDTYTGLKAGLSSTGNGQRTSFRTLPGVGTTNFMISPGDKTPGELLEGIERGFYITEVMGMHTANPITGEFSVGAAGIMIEKGKLSYPVKGATIAGNIIDLLQKVDGIGNDIRFYGSRAAPSLRIKSLSVGGV
ncbi:PmbA protein [Thermosyntropha lipolytica DSM 11003]|uniref:PmbA protein n=1 Tax=Thermosyntropha lipolytica DSM 11003 TaxID=1123382 RepID=A0A1M5LM23_9FIRM|nr:TldD/PmbA family protein [Thermosyntropha lipolytica]SHG66006.1 PmbA protein [Thermosyntropha lipolytica DSM 11003]